MENTNKPYLQGIGGWLILLAISLCLSIPVLIGQIIMLFISVFSADSWALFSSGDIPGLLPLVIAEFVVNFVLLFGHCYLAYLFFTKNYKTPMFFIALKLLNLIILIVDTLLANWIVEEFFIDWEDSKDIIRLVIYCAIVIPYLLMSVRVKNTFINGRPDKNTVISNHSTLVS